MSRCRGPGEQKELARSKLSLQPRRLPANDTRLQIPRPLVSSSDRMPARLLSPRPPSSFSSSFSFPSTLFVSKHLLLDKFENKSSLPFQPQHYHSAYWLSPLPPHSTYHHGGITQHTGPILEASGIILRDPSFQDHFCHLFPRHFSLQPL